VRQMREMYFSFDAQFRKKFSNFSVRPPKSLPPPAMAQLCSAQGQ
jgi:hypothetical protein